MWCHNNGIGIRINSPKLLLNFGFTQKVRIDHMIDSTQTVVITVFSQME